MQIHGDGKGSGFCKSPRGKPKCILKKERALLARGRELRSSSEASFIKSIQCQAAPSSTEQVRLAGKQQQKLPPPPLLSLQCQATRGKNEVDILLKILPFVHATLKYKANRYAPAL